MIATPEMLASLEPGEWLVRCLRDGWTIPPNHIAVAQAKQRMRNYTPTPGTYRGRAPNDRQAECLQEAR